MQVIVLLGPPACGKGTQAARLEKQGYEIFSPSKYLRERAKRGDEIGRIITEKMNAGELAPDEIVAQGVREAVESALARGIRGLVLDGTPRTMGQTLELDALMNKNGLKLKVLALLASEEELNRRRQKRVDETRAAGKDVRKDDDEAVFRNRMNVYRQQTMPIRDHYRAKGRLTLIDASRTLEETTKQVHAALGLKAGPGPGAPKKGPFSCCP